MSVRPRSIVWFERILYLNQALALVVAWLMARPNAGMPHHPPEAVIAILLLVGVTIATNLLLGWLIAYRASNLARWIIIVLIAGAFVSLINFDVTIPYGAALTAVSLASWK